MTVGVNSGTGDGCVVKRAERKWVNGRSSSESRIACRDTVGTTSTTTSNGGG